MVIIIFGLFGSLGLPDGTSFFGVLFMVQSSCGFGQAGGAENRFSTVHSKLHKGRSGDTALTHPTEIHWIADVG
jgi:hypothetical protein